METKQRAIIILPTILAILALGCMALLYPAVFRPATIAMPIVLGAGMITLLVRERHSHKNGGPKGRNVKLIIALVGAVFVIAMTLVSLTVGYQPLILIVTIVGTSIVVMIGFYLDRQAKR
ncbi:hypothetical protein LJ754_15255 [Arthrobacter sp. zg-Y40]|uniref:hypothetical protein n=1 Tax=unclassified Arthrobacter TaxID=235627 RepID=UPI001D14A96E|nr:MULTISPECIES: hypothetical protein [unclassified Arthrobacter]MCC3280506.1 hypothetical protein [Arthrobacter sp. zg-Y40]MDK1329116.1 hypothetical protein [Arthrobacter sp. zg-Y1143]